MVNENDVKLSIVIACHNCRNYIQRLLNSILIQEFPGIEVIISDDNSTDNFMELVEPYEKLLNIKYFKTNEHKVHCPGNTRMDGLSHATGKWVTFIDHDDLFISGMFHPLFNSLKENDGEDLPLIFSPVKRYIDPEHQDLLDAATWLHGNFYNREFLIKNNINFKEDLFGNEDLYFNNLVNGHIKGQGLAYFKYENPIYLWVHNPESLSNKDTTQDVQYTEKYFKDYLISNSEPHIHCLHMYPEKANLFQAELLQCLRFCYVYYQRTLYIYEDKSVQEQMLTEINQTYKHILKELNFTKQEVIDILYKDVDSFNFSYNIVQNLSGKFIPKQSMLEFFNLLDVK